MGNFRQKDLSKDCEYPQRHRAIALFGLGKPEALKHELSGYWSGRINDEHRLVYTVTDDEIIVISCKYHY